MNIAVVSTTVHLPLALGEYRRINRDAELIVAGDVSGPQTEIAAYCQGIGARYLSYEEQGRLGYAVHEVIGPRSIQRRAVAILEAIRAGASHVFTVDTDNVPVVDDFFAQLEQAFMPTSTPPARVIAADGAWLNPGDFATPTPFVQRGFPEQRRHDHRGYQVRTAEPRAGVAQCLILGDPDTNAIDRIVSRPEVRGYRFDGVLTDPRETWAPINSQATCYVRELAPLMAYLPGVGRFDDIWQGWLAQRVMEATDYQVYFGQPFVRQDRHEHDLLADLEAEMHGMRHSEAFVALLRGARVSPNASVLDNLAGVVDYLRLAAPDCVLPPQAKRFLRAWVEDVGRVL